MLYLLKWERGVQDACVGGLVVGIQGFYVEYAGFEMTTRHARGCV